MCTLPVCKAHLRHRAAAAPPHGTRDPRPPSSLEQGRPAGVAAQPRSLGTDAVDTPAAAIDAVPMAVPSHVAVSTPTIEPRCKQSRRCCRTAGGTKVGRVSRNSKTQFENCVVASLHLQLSYSRISSKIYALALRVSSDKWQSNRFLQLQTPCPPVSIASLRRRTTRL